MWPRIGPIPTYAITYAVAIVVHFWLSKGAARRLGLNRRVWLAVSLSYLAGMTVGAKALYDIHHSQFRLWALLNPRHYFQGGLWGGLLAYIVIAVPLTMVLARPRREALDLVALSIPVPWSLAKLGCLLNGCCYGRASSLPWAVVFPEGPGSVPAGVPMHPTQIYEILAMAAILLAFRALRHDRWRGTMLFWFLMVYGFGRAAIDTTRGDTDHHVCIGPATMTQLVCLATGIAAAVLLVWWRHAAVPQSPPEGVA